MSYNSGCLPSPFDPGKAQDVLAALNSWQTERTRPVAVDARGEALIAALAGNSPYLARTMTREPAWAAGLATRPFDDQFADLIRTLGAEAPHLSAQADLMRLLRRVKARAALIIAAADVAGAWTLETVTEALTDLAEACLGHAVAHLLHGAMSAGELAWPRGAPEDRTPALAADTGLIVLGLGKLGGRELNYSSDIDLIVLYDDMVARYTGRRSPGDFFVRLTRDLLRIMDQRTPDGYVFRTDLRLRPDPSATPLALSTDAAEIYYQSAALNWERAAMIKARPVAGDVAAGEAYLERLSPFVWRRSLDYAAIDDIHAIKNQIHRHHGHRGVTLAGHDVKLGPGGIREIEFFVQIHQLISGGRDWSLRRRATLDALEALVASDRVPRATADELAAAYRFLRTLEHRLQMVADEQTHKLPKDTQDLDRIAAFMTLDGRDDLAAHLARYTDCVQHHYDVLLPEPVSSATLAGPALIDKLTRAGFTDPASAAETIDRWRRGRYRATRTTRARQILENVLPPLLDALGRTNDPDRALARFDAFVSQLPSGIQLFSLFQSNPSLFGLIGRIMGIAPALADQLAKQAALLDVVLEPHFFDPLPDRAELADELAGVMGRAGDYQDALDLSRAWVNERRFQIGVHILESMADVSEAGAALTTIAELTLEQLIPVVEDDFARRHGRFPGGALAVVAMGKFGGRELSITSDLDVVLLYHTDGSAEQSDGPRPLSPSLYFSRLGQHVITAITALTRNGRLFEVDTRLRPSGSAGPLVVTLKTFHDYYAEQAWTWEHMALTRARVVYGAPDVADRIRTTITQALTSPRDGPSLLAAVANMRERLFAEFGSDSPWAVKHVRGGLIDIEFICQYLMLLEGGAQPAIFAPSIDDAIGRLAAAGALAATDADLLREGHTLLATVQGLLRLCLSDPAGESVLADGLKDTLARATKRRSFGELETDVVRIESDIHALYDRIIADLASALHQP